jgi:hypothetical protein
MHVKKNIVTILIMSIVLFTLSQCTMKKAISKSETVNRIIDFSGYKWLVRNTNQLKYGPGPNFFSNSIENVWVDEAGKLHLKIINKDENWYCAEVTLNQQVGYGKYIFYINSSLTNLEDNVVVGLFTYLDDSQEIDIEFSKWSLKDNENSQFVVQPYEKEGNIFRFDMNDSLGSTTHSFEWNKNHIVFESKYGQNENELPYISWTYTGKNIPLKSDERLKINLWLYQGKAPMNNKSQEIIIDSIRYIPSY